jgi:hypothetical protein
LNSETLSRNSAKSLTRRARSGRAHSRQRFITQRVMSFPKCRVTSAHKVSRRALRHGAGCHERASNGRVEGELAR